MMNKRLLLSKEQFEAFTAEIKQFIYGGPTTPEGYPCIVVYCEYDNPESATDFLEYEYVYFGDFPADLDDEETTESDTVRCLKCGKWISKEWGHESPCTHNAVPKI